MLHSRRWHSADSICFVDRIYRSLKLRGHLKVQPTTVLVFTAKGAIIITKLTKSTKKNKKTFILLIDG
jgi:hypothetical protein